MNGLNISDWILLAQGDGAAPGPAGGGLPQLLMMFAPIVLLYVFLIQRPQKKEQMRRRVMLENLKKNDHVITTGGIYGVVTNIRPDGDEISIRVDETTNTKMRVLRSAIARVIGDDDAAATAKDSSASAKESTAAG